MVKHGKLLARSWAEEGSFHTTIQRNKGHEFDLPLLETGDALVTFDLTTRDTYTPWGKPDEIRFDVTVVCKHCGQRGRFGHGRTSFGSGTDRELFLCLCGRCCVQIVFQFRPNDCFDLVDWLPLLGSAARAGAAAASHVAGEHTAARRHWHQAAQNLVPRAVADRKLLHKDGALMRIAELLPGSNVFAAALHENAGHREEALRALDILKSWQDIGSPDGALARLAELFPGMDLVAFALHVNAGSFAQALRAVTKVAAITIRVDSVSVLLSVSEAGNLACRDVFLAGLQIGPSQRFVTGALIDMAEDFLNFRRELMANCETSEESATGSTRSGATYLSEAGDIDSGQASGHLAALTRFAEEELSNRLARGLQSAQEQVPALVEAGFVAASAEIARLRQRNWLLRWLLPQALPLPGSRAAPALVNSLRLVVQGTTLIHHDVLPTVDPVTIAASDLEAALVRWMVAAAAVLLLILLALRLFRLSACLVLLAAADALLTPGLRLASLAERAAAWLTVRNAGIWSEASGWGMLQRGSGVEMCGLRFGLGTGAPAPACPVMPPGVLVEVPVGPANAALAAAAGCLLEALPLLGGLLRLLLPLLWAAARGLVPGVAALPVAVPIDVEDVVLDAQSQPQWPFAGRALRIPRARLAALLELGLAAGSPPVTRARLLVPDAWTTRATGALASQVSALDLRCCSRRLSGFSQDLRCSLELHASWPRPDQLLLEARDVKTTLYLPE